MWTSAWPEYRRRLVGEAGEGVVRDGQDDQLDLVEDGCRFGERARAADEPAEPLPATGIAAGHRGDRPAAAAEGDPEGRADGSGTDDPQERRVAGRGVLVGMAVGVRSAVRVIVTTSRLGRQLQAGLRGHGRQACLARCRGVLLAVSRVAPRLAPDLHRRQYDSTPRV